MNDQKKNSWVKDFEGFLAAPEIAPPRELSRKVVEQVHAALSPSPFYVFTKAFFVHVLVGLATLLVCPQFGLGLYWDIGLAHLLMRYGHHACMLGCGALFLGSSALTVSLVLRPEELAVLRRARVLQFSALGVLSVLAFVAAGGDVALVYGLSWLVGCVAGAVALFESGWAARQLWWRRRAQGI